MNSSLILLAVLLAIGATRPLHAAIGKDETVLLYPALAKTAKNGWEVEWRGVVFEPERRGLALFAIRRALGLADITMTPEEEKVFAQRSRLFLVDHERRKTIRVRAGEQEWRLGRSGADGRFGARLFLASNQIASSWIAGPTRIDVPLNLADGDQRPIVGELHLVGRQGLSVISDIDDTIKVSEVLDREALLRNTFCRPFVAVPGMPETYRGWAEQPGVVFHYVSASPWQLYEPLKAFVRSNAFPAGTFHLKQFRLKDRSVLDLLASPEKYKLGAIEPILRQFPERRFVLTGDSGEKDPEIYATLMRRYPKQIAMILIRDVTKEAADSQRYQRTFRGLDRDRWRIFDDPQEIRSVLSTISTSPGKHD